jgi:hypothetical protein
MRDLYMGFGPDFWWLPMATHGALMDVVVYAPLALSGRTGSYEAVHLVKGLLYSSSAILVAAALAGIARRRDTPVWGFLFLALMPRFWGDMFDNHMDGASTLLYGAGVLLGSCLLRATDPRAAAALTVLAAAISAIAFSHRAVLLVLPASLAVGAAARLGARPPARAALGGAAAFGAVFLATTWLVDPYVRAVGARALLDRMRASAALPFATDVLFEGATIPSHAVPRRYVPEWIAITTPPATLLFLAIGIAVLARRMGRDDPRARAVAAFLLASLCLPLLACVVLGPTLYDGWRHVLFLAVPMAIAAALGLEHALASSRRILALTAGAVAALGFAATAAAMVRLHPYQYVYFNASVGGLRGAAGRYDTDYWAKSYREAALWLATRELATGPPRMVHACGPPEPAHYYLGGRAREAADPGRAEYAICFTRGGADGKLPPGDVIHEVARDGVALCRVVRLRRGPVEAAGGMLRPAP